MISVYCKNFRSKNRNFLKNHKTKEEGNTRNGTRINKTPLKKSSEIKFKDYIILSFKRHYYKIKRDSQIIQEYL